MSQAILIPPVSGKVVFYTQSCLTLWDPTDCSPPGSSIHGDSPGKNTGVGCHALLQEIVPIQGLNPGLPHCKREKSRWCMGLSKGQLWLRRNIPFLLNPVTLVTQMVKYLRLIPGWEDPLQEGTVTHSSILAWRIPMDRGAWWVTVHGVAKNRMQLSTAQHLMALILRIYIIILTQIKIGNFIIYMTYTMEVINLKNYSWQNLIT